MKNTSIMKNASIMGILLCIILIPFSSFGQKTSSGIIDYTMTVQRKKSNNTNSNAQDNRPQEFTRDMQLIFDNTSGKFASSGSKKHDGRFGAEFVDFKDKSFSRAFKRKNNDTTFYIPQPFKEAKSFKLTGNTKKILGYNAKEATASLRKGNATIWFTNDIPVTFSPVNGLIPPQGGLVLDIKDNRMHYQATKVDLKNIESADVTIPTPSHQLSKEEIQKMRKHMSNNRRGKRKHSENHKKG